MPHQPIQIKEILVQGNYGQLQIALAEGHVATIVQKTGDITYQLPRIIKDSQVVDSLRVEHVLELIQAIATNAKDHAEDAKDNPGLITRSITDEFTFYPKDRPFSLDEYKQIINETAEIATKLPPDVHLMLATFPVQWPDGGIHACGLYVESPKNEGEKSTIHHISKKNHSPIDINYQKKGVFDNNYKLTTDKDCTPATLPAALLQGSAVSTNDVNQYAAALKLSTSDGREFISTIGICLDHTIGTEREDVRGLINQLQENEQPVPLHCSHVITSGSVTERNDHVLSTISHADPKKDARRNTYQSPSHKHYPARTNFTPQSITSHFSGQLNAESFPPKHIGTLHGDLFQQITANQPDITDKLNTQDDETGNTLLHGVFFETDFDRELMSKRLYSMILNGGDPDLKNNQGQSARDLAIQADKDAGLGDQMVSNAINSALEWRVKTKAQNTPTPPDNRTPLTRLLSDPQTSIQHKMDRINLAIHQGANPYVKDGHGESAMDLINKYPPKDRVTLKNYVLDEFKNTQFGYRPNSKGNLQNRPEDWFTPPPPLLPQIDAIHKIKSDYKEQTRSPLKFGDDIDKANIINHHVAGIHAGLERSDLEAVRSSFNDMKSQLSKFRQITFFGGKPTEEKKLVDKVEEQLNSTKSLPSGPATEQDYAESTMDTNSTHEPKTPTLPSAGTIENESVRTEEEHDATDETNKKPSSAPN